MDQAHILFNKNNLFKKILKENEATVLYIKRKRKNNIKKDKDMSSQGIKFKVSTVSKNGTRIQR